MKTSTQEAKKKNKENLKLLKEEEKKLKEIEESISKLRHLADIESRILDQQIEKLGHSDDYRKIIRIEDSVYLFSNKKFQHGLLKNNYHKFDLYDVVDQIIPPSKKKSHLGFKMGQEIKLKQEGFVPFRIDVPSGDSFNFPVDIEIVTERSSHYVLGVRHPERIKNPFVVTRIMCFYKDGKALVRYSHRRSSKYYEMVDLSNYESCDLDWCKPMEPWGVERKEFDRKKFPKYLKENGLAEKIEFDDKFGFRVDDVIYIKSHEIMLKNPAKDHNGEYMYYDDNFCFLMGEKDLRHMQSFAFARSTKLEIVESHNCVWKVFGFIGDKVLVSTNFHMRFRHFELFSPDEIGLLIDLKYRIARETSRASHSL